MASTNVNMAPTATSAAIAEETGVAGEINSLNGALGELELLINDHQVALEIAMRPSEPRSEGADCPEDELCPMGSRVRDARKRLVNLTDALRALHHRLNLA